MDSHDHDDTGEILTLTETPAGGVIRLVDTSASVPYPLPSGAKGRARERRPLERVDVWLVHQTAVRGGFGVTERMIAAVMCDHPHLSREDAIAVARQLRYRKTPYHSVYDPQSRQSVVQWPAWAYMYHGNGGNSRSFAWSYDGKTGDEIDVDGARESALHSIQTAREQGARLAVVESHAQHSAQRCGDPGADLWRGVVLWACEREGLAVSTRTTGTGKVPTWQISHAPDDE